MTDLTIAAASGNAPAITAFRNIQFIAAFADGSVLRDRVSGSCGGIAMSYADAAGAERLIRVDDEIPPVEPHNLIETTLPPKFAENREFDVVHN
jgi:hypothetical protein